MDNIFELTKVGIHTNHLNFTDFVMLKIPSYRVEKLIEDLQASLDEDGDYTYLSFETDEIADKREALDG